MFWHKSQSSGPKIHDFCSLSARGHFFGCYNTSLTPENRGRCSSRRHDNENTAFPLAFLQHMEMWHSGRVLNDCNCKWNFFLSRMMELHFPQQFWSAVCHEMIMYLGESTFGVSASFIIATSAWEWTGSIYPHTAYLCPLHDSKKRRSNA